MNIMLTKVRPEEKQILANLLEKYLYEFSRYTGEVPNKLGLFGYDYLDHYWTEPDMRFPYFIKSGDNIAGFSMVKKHIAAVDKNLDFSMAEFFVIHKYRGTGVAKQAFFETLALHKGKWELFYHPKNLVSEKFWVKAIDEHTNGKYELVKNYSAIKYTDGTPDDKGTPANIFFFVSK